MKRTLHQLLLLVLVELLSMGNCCAMEVQTCLTQIDLNHALFNAIDEGVDVDAVKKLIDARANVNVIIKGRLGGTPLTRAAYKNRADIITELLRAGAHVHGTDMCGNVPLHCAVTFNNGDAAKALVEAKADINKAKKKTRMTLLHEAANVGFASMVKLLVNSGAYPNAQNSLKETPAHVIINKGHSKEPRTLLDTDTILATLIEAGADLTLLDNQGRTVVQSAVQEKDVKALKALVTSVSAAEVQHIITGMLVFKFGFPRDLNIALSRDIRQLLRKGLVQDLVSRKLAQARNYFPQEQDAELQNLVRASIQRVMQNPLYASFYLRAKGDKKFLCSSKKRKTCVQAKQTYL